MVLPGIEVLLAERPDLCRAGRAAILCHAASVAPDLSHVVDRLLGHGVSLVRLFGPEHGVRADAQDMVGVDGEVDRSSGLPVVSLYGTSFESLSPPPGSLTDIDLLFVDLQDIGSRYYTYVWTMALAMQAAAREGTKVVVLDRPNPIGGLAETIEGGSVEPEVESFVGLAPVPVRHGLTIGEMARLVRAGLPWGGVRFRNPLDVDLEVVVMRGWTRAMTFDETRLPWVMPSPNMPTLDTAFVYPGLCLLEGTNVSEGRGTTRPFELIGAPFIDGQKLAAAMSAFALPGVRFRPTCVRPTFHKFAGKPCGGIQLHVIDRTTFRPYRTGVALLTALWAVGGQAFAWRRESYEFVTNHPAIDLLTGGSAVRLGVERGLPIEEIFASWAGPERAFEERRRPHLLYD